MSIKSFLGALLLSILVTLLSGYANLFIATAGWSGYGFPFKYGSSSFAGGDSFNSESFIADVVVWFVFVWILWRVRLMVGKKTSSR